MKPFGWLALAIDVLAVVVFVAIGRSSHTEGITFSGMASTSWPFLVGLAVAWSTPVVRRAPFRLVPAAVVVWLATVGIGMILRVVAGQGIALAFVFVALGFLCAALLGWRLVARIYRSIVKPRSDSGAPPLAAGR